MLIRKTVIQVSIGIVAALAGIGGRTIALAALPDEEAIDPSPADAQVLPSPTESEQIAQFFPYANIDEQTVMVQGQGVASAAAETAEIELVFVNYDPYYDPYACYYDESGLLPETIDLSRIEPCPAPPEPLSLGRTSLQPAIDALVNGGIVRNDIRLRLPSDPAPDNDFATLYYPNSASLSLTVANPTRQQVQELVTAVENSVANHESLYLQDRYVQYTLSTAGCQALERDAYRDAVANARSRAAVVAEALGVEIGDVPSVADSALSLSGIFGSAAGFFGGTTSYCDAETASGSIFGTSFPSPSYYDSLAPAEVRSQRSIFVTYPVRRSR
ncbi:SIMPL domain-containing protein [Egbenema bharatensis]|uniref:SIMPL domain-containing protein n=1 Tax=Egbenema bharatensis TaxID=3463334 RepID=UPI003A8A4CFA